MGHAMKITNNLLATTIMAANTEALAIGIKSGLTPRPDDRGHADHHGLEQPARGRHAEEGVHRRRQPGFMVKLAAKDVRLAIELAQAQGFEALVGRGAQRTLERAMEKGFGDRDTAALMRIREDELGIEVRPAAQPR